MKEVSPMTESKALAQGPGALAGLRVIDLTRVLGGPYCTMVLSDHGGGGVYNCTRAFLPMLCNGGNLLVLVSPRAGTSQPMV